MWMCAPLLYQVGISIFSDIELRFEFYFLCACSLDRAEAPGEVSLKNPIFNISCILNLSQLHESSFLKTLNT